MSINGISSNYAVGTAAYIKNQTAAATAEKSAASTGSARSQDTVTISAEGQAAAKGASITIDYTQLRNRVEISDAALACASENAFKCAEGTTFTSNFEQESAMHLEWSAISRAYYTEQLNESLSFDNPRQHMWDKYKNPDSPYFRDYMTEKERDFAYTNELLLYKTGRLNHSLVFDYALRSERQYAHISTQEILVNQRTRDQIESAVANAIKQNGIELPEGATFELSVDPYDYHISVVGLEDSAIAEQIEKAINTGDNGMRLYHHIHACNTDKFGFDTAEQYTKLDERKSGLFQMVKDQTGLDIRTLERKDGAILTPDGKDLWQVIMQIAAGLPTGDGKFGADMSYYKPAYDIIAKYGWTDGGGLALSFQNGSLYDIGTDYGYGDTQNLWTKWALENPAVASKQMMKWVEARAIDLQVQREDDR